MKSSKRNIIKKRTIQNHLFSPQIQLDVGGKKGRERKREREGERERRRKTSKKTSCHINNKKDPQRLKISHRAFEVIFYFIFCCMLYLLFFFFPWYVDKFFLKKDLWKAEKKAVQEVFTDLVQTEERFLLLSMQTAILWTKGTRLTWCQIFSELRAYTMQAPSTITQV